VVHHQRERILAAVLELVAEKGYRGTSVAAIVKRAGVAKAKFYENFSSKQDAFLVAFDGAVAQAAQRVQAAVETGRQPPAARVEAGVEALLGFLDERPAAARACIVQIPSVGPPLGERRERALAAFAPLVAGLRQGDAEGTLPAELEETVLEGLYWLLYEALTAGQPEALGDLRSALVRFALGAFLGPAGAADAASP
jgi:AcrR family transcriptional regulator